MPDLPEHSLLAGAIVQKYRLLVNIYIQTHKVSSGTLKILNLFNVSSQRNNQSN